MEPRASDAPPRASLFGRFEAALAAVGTGWILVLMAIICADIVGRAAFKAPILGVPEMVQFSIVGIVFLQLPLTLRTDGLTRSDVLLGSLKRRAPRLGHALQLLFDLIGCGLLLVIVTTTWPLMRQAFANNEFFGSTGVVHIPTGPLKVIIILGCATMALQFVLHAVRDLREMLAPRA